MRYARRMIQTNQQASGESLHDLRQRVLQGLPCRAEVLVNMIDALSVGPRPATPSEIVLSPLWGYASSTLYAGLREGAEAATVMKDFMPRSLKSFMYLVKSLVYQRKE